MTLGECGLRSWSLIYLVGPARYQVRQNLPRSQSQAGSPLGQGSSRLPASKHIEVIHSASKIVIFFRSVHFVGDYEKGGEASGIDTSSRVSKDRRYS